MSYQVAMIKGDLNGKTVSDAVLKVDEAVRPAMSQPIEWTQMPYDVDYFCRHNVTALRKEELDELRKYAAIFLGAVGDDTRIKRGTMELGTLLKVRQAFNQRVNLRPIVLPEGVESPIRGKDHRHINFEICRENAEGLYINKGWIENEDDIENAVAYQIMRYSFKGVEQVALFALDRARRRNRFDKPRLHFVFKGNVLTYAGKIWDAVHDKFKEKYTDVDIRYLHIDNFLMQMIQEPEQFDVVVTSNMFGDIATDAGAIIQGGIGTAVSGNINLDGEYPSMFEPIHGSAPDKWYELDENRKPIPKTFVPEKVQLIRPEAAIMSYAMMLEQMGETRAAEVVKAAALANIRDPDYKVKKLDQLVEQACGFVRRAA